MNEEKKVRIPLVRHEWPDERVARRKKNFRNGLVIVALVFAFGLGYTVHGAFNTVVPVQTDTSEFSRLKAVYEVLVNDWYFGKDMNDLDTQLINEAILGMVESTGDPHTAYMTTEEVQSFSESIDRGFVGIGVSYFDNNGTYIVERVFIDSPADKAGVQAGDIIHIVDGVEVTNIGSDTLVDLVRGEENTIVSIDFIREGEIVHLDIPRGQINNTAFGKMLDKDTAYLEIYQFGTTTSTEVRQYLDIFKAANATNILIDMRDNGGGYLTSLEEIGSLFIPKDMILIQQNTRDDRTLVSKSTGNVIIDFDEIVILVNENTASAAEVLTAAIKEDIGATVVGVTTYGKGTVQQQAPFSDGAALKYTVAEWFTPLGNTIQGTGITPDVIVTQHPVMTTDFTDLEEGESYQIDSVHPAVLDTQLALDFLGYDIDRQDGYYSLATENAVKAYQTANNLTVDGIITKDLLDSLKSEVVRIWHIEKATKDLQTIKALELLNG